MATTRPPRSRVSRQASNVEAGHPVALAVHLVVLDLVDLDRAERAQPHDQPDLGHLHALVDEPVEQRMGQVQAGGRSGGGLGLRVARVDGLVALLVRQRLVDVGRQGHLAGRLDALEQVGVAVVGQLDEADAVADGLAHRDREDPRAGRVVQDGARRDSPAGAHERLPGGRAALFEQQHLDRAAGGLHQTQPGRQHPGAIDHDEVSGVEQVRQVAHVAVVGAGEGVDQQAGGVAWLDRLLGDARLGQVVVELGGVHGGPR